LRLFNDINLFKNHIFVHNFQLTPFLARWHIFQIFLLCFCSQFSLKIWLKAASNNHATVSILGSLETFSKILFCHLST
jgi:hypothetical protein